MKLIPLADRVVIKALEAEETTKSGIILSSKSQEKPQVAEVVAVGPGGIVDGNEVKMTENIDYGDTELTPLIEGEENYRYNEGYADAGYSEVDPQDGEMFDNFDDENYGFSESFSDNEDFED